MISFDLTVEPWIRCRTLDDRICDLSLTQLFERAHTLRALAGEIPTQDAALLRLLLAILYRATLHRDDEQTASERWASWWASGHIPHSFTSYLRERADRFDLLHPTAPFMQVAALRTATGRTTGIGKLIAELPANIPYFTTRSGVESTRLSHAEAARWLVHCHAFDPSGIKSGAVDDPSAKGGKGYPIGTGWCGNLGLVFAEGTTLAGTLLLNLVHHPGSTPDDSPVWERAPQSGARDGVPTPRGPADLLTWQSRRIRLFSDGEHVTDALICNGDPLGAQNMLQSEYYTAWKRSENQEKKAGGVVYMPVRHRLETAVWRGFEGLLSGTSAPASRGEADERREPQVLSWIAGLRHNDILPGAAPIRWRAVGIEYGSNASVIDAVLDDVIAVAAATLSDGPLRVLASDAAVDARLAVRALADLAGNIARAAGTSVDQARNDATEDGFHRLDQPYRTWVRELTPGDSSAAVHARWQMVVRREIHRAAMDVEQNAGVRAFIGRELTDARGKSRYWDVGLARVFFDGAIAKVLPLAVPAPSVATDNAAQEDIT